MPDTHNVLPGRYPSMAKALTVKQIEALSGGQSRSEVPDPLLPGLYIVVQPSGAKSWAIRYRHQGKPRKLTLGAYPAIDLASARELGRTALRASAEGRDPAGEKRVARHAAARAASEPTDLLPDVVDQFIARYVKSNNRASTAAETERLLRKDVVPEWRGRRVQEIAKKDVLALLDKIVDRGAAIGANRTLAAMRRMFNWCVDRGLLEASPCDRVRAPTGERSRDRVLTDAELAEVWHASEKIGWPFGPMVQVLMLTAQRRGEVAGMRWPEIDLEQALWVIPRERSKNGIAHEVPLSPNVVALLEGLPHIRSQAGFVFTTTGESIVTGYSRAKFRLDKEIMDHRQEAAAEFDDPDRKVEAMTPWTIHDLRRTAATGMARLGIAVPVVEKVLNHTSGSFAGVAGVYQRHSFSEEKRDALSRWAQLITEKARTL